MVHMEKKREKLVVGLTRSGCTSSSPPTAAATESNRSESQGGNYSAVFRRKKVKAKAMKWRSSNDGMNGKGEAGGSDGDCNDRVLSSLTTASFSGLMSRKRVRTLGKVAEDCDGVDPPVPRKLRSAINKHAGRTVSSSSRYVKKRRHLSAIGNQAFFMDRQTRFNEGSLLNSFTMEEEVVAGALLSLSQLPPPEDSPNINVVSTSCSEGVVIREEEKITALPPSAASQVATQPACTDQTVERTGNVLQANHVPCATYNNESSHLSKDGQIKEISLGIVANSPNPSKEGSNSSSWKQLRVQFDGSPTHAAKTEASHWLVNSSKPDNVVHDGEKAKDSSAQENARLVQTPLPCTSHGCLIKPCTSTLAVRTNSGIETTKANATGNNDKLSLSKNGGATKPWKRSTTHVYVSHLIQMHLNKDKASQNRAKPEERSDGRASRPPSGSTLKKNNAQQDERLYAVHFDARLPVQPSNAGHQKMANGGFLNLPTTAAQHVQYLQPQITPAGAIVPYPSPHHPYSRGNLAPATALQQMTQYMCSAGYPPRPSLPATTAVMKLQQLVPAQQQQQQQVWPFHFPPYQPRPDAGAAWQQSSRLLLQDMPSMPPVVPVLPPLAMPPPPPPPQMDLFCAPFHGGGRQPTQLRLI